MTSHNITSRIEQNLANMADAQHHLTEWSEVHDKDDFQPSHHSDFMDWQKQNAGWLKINVDVVVDTIDGRMRSNDL